MVRFISTAFHIYASLYETVPDFADTWAEILGDLARYRGTVADEGTESRKKWQKMSQVWYNSAADRNPSEGRLYYHLAILSRPEYIKQLFYFCRSLTSGSIFLSARETIITLFAHCSGTSTNQSRAFINHFMRTHFSLFRNDFSEAHQHAVDFLRSFKLPSAYPPGRWLEESTQIAIINIASLLDYGNWTPLRYTFEMRNHLSSLSTSVEGKEEELPDALRKPLLVGVPDLLDYKLKSDFLFGTLEIIRSSHRNLVLPHIHTVMTFLVSLVQAVAVTNKRFASGVIDLQLFFERVPWRSLCDFLNGSIFDMARKGVVEPFSRSNADQSRPLPEDYLLRGLIWTRNYFPSNWFETHMDMEDRLLDSVSTSKLRVERIIWLAHQLCFVRSTTHRRFHSTNAVPARLYDF